MEMSTTGMRHSSVPIGWRAYVWQGSLSIVLAVMQFRIIGLVLGSHYGASIAAAKGVVEGTPHWLVYQSRLLGPWTVELISKLTGDFGRAYVCYVIAATAVAGWLTLDTVRGRFGVEAGWGALFLFHMLFAALLSPPWLYAWDHYGLIIFVLFVRYVMDGKDWRWFTALFVVALFNRESAFYIALWMILDPLVKAICDRTATGWAMLAAGLTCMTWGAVVIRFLREYLLVREIGPELFHMPEAAGRAVHFKWRENLEFLSSIVTDFSLRFDVLIPVFLLAAAALAVVLALRDPRRYLALSATHLALVASVMMVGLVQETRVMLELVPFLCIGAWIALQEFLPPFDLPKAAAAAASAR